MGYIFLSEFSESLDISIHAVPRRSEAARARTPMNPEGRDDKVQISTEVVVRANPGGWR